jgi:hypothetical protein
MERRAYPSMELRVASRLDAQRAWNSVKAEPNTVGDVFVMLLEGEPS